MVSEKQVVANKRNAKKSTGPTSKPGKKVIANNALKHGLTAQEHLLLPGESVEDLVQLRTRLWQDVQPSGVIEEELVDRIVDGLWRLRRATHIETGILTYAYHDRVCKEAERKLAEGKVPDFSRFISDVPDALDDAEETLRMAVETRDKEVSFLGQAFIEDAENRNALTKLSRYETTLWNQVLKARQELTALQEKRVDSVDFEVVR